MPVLVIGPLAATTAPPQTLHKILFATDFERESIDALPLAAAFAKELGASLALLNVKRGSERFPDFIAKLPELMTAQEGAVDESVDRLRQLGRPFCDFGHDTRRIARRSHKSDSRLRKAGVDQCSCFRNSKRRIRRCSRNAYSQSCWQLCRNGYMPCTNSPKYTSKPRLPGPSDLWILTIRRVDIDSLRTQTYKDLGHHKLVMLMSGLGRLP